MSDAPEKRPARLRPKNRRKDYLKSHTRIAEAMTEMITTEPHGGVAIALTGKWGSGKSYCVEAVRDRLTSESAESCETRVLHFDAWAHRGAPLGRSFLRALADTLYPTDGRTQWISCDTNTEVQRELDYRLRHERPATPAARPPAALPGYWIATGLVPLGACTSAMAVVWPGFGVVGIALALVGAVALRVVARAEMLSHEKTHGLRAVPQRRKFGLVGMETFEPSSYEFQAIFLNLMEEAVIKDRRLVVVVDNLDRSSASDTQGVWDTLATFFQPEAWKSFDWFDGYWLLVPFDRSKVGDAVGYIDRAFHVEFRVPEPLLGNWLPMLEDEIRCVLPECDSTEAAAIVTAFQAVVHESTGASPTPRDIEQFARGVYAQSLIRQPGVRIEHQALYVALRQVAGQTDEDILALLVSSPDGMARYEALFERPGWDDALASLHTGLEPEAAADVLLQPRLRGALAAQDAAEVVRLRDKHGGDRLRECVRYVLLRVESDLGVRPRSICNAAVTLVAAKENDPGAWECLRRQACQIEWWHGADEILADTFVAILDHSLPRDREDTAGALLGGLVTSMSQTDPRVPLGEDAWAEAVSKVVPYALGNPSPDVLTTPRIIPGGATVFVNYMTPLAVSGDILAMQGFVPDCSPRQVVDLVGEQLDSGESVSDQALLDAFTRIGGRWDLSSWAVRLGDKLGTHASSPAPKDYAAVAEGLREALRHLFALRTFGNDATADAALQAVRDLVANESMLILLDWTHVVQEDEARCLVALFLFWDGDGGVNHAQNRNYAHRGAERYRSFQNRSRPELVALLAGLVVELRVVPDLLEAASHVDLATRHAWSVLQLIVEKTGADNVASGEVRGVADALRTAGRGNVEHYTVIANVVAAFEDGRLPRPGCATFGDMDRFVRGDTGDDA